MAMLGKILPILLLFSPLLAVATSTGSCSTRYTQANFILKDHVNETIPGVESSEVCIAKCKERGNCHSINYYDDTSVCEVNDANHVSNPECLIPSFNEGEYRNYHEHPTETCSLKLCSDKYLCVIDSNEDDLYRCCSPAEIALRFPRVSTDDYVVFEKPFPRNLTALTISMWLKMSNKSISNPGDTHTPVSYALNDVLENELMIGIYTNQVWFAIDNKGKYEPMPANYHDDEWHHFCLTWDGSSQQHSLYVDSNVIFQRNWTSPKQVTEGGAMVIGQDQDDYIKGFQTSQSFKGYISKLNMWDRAMDSSEVKNLYNACADVQEGNAMKWSDVYTQNKYGKVALLCMNSCG